MKKELCILFIMSGFLLNCTTMKSTTQSTNGINGLNGTWELNYISGPRIAFDGLYPEKKPTIKFDVTDKRVSGNTSCNSFSGPLDADDVKINFNQPLMMTKMYCPGAGENTFLETLKKVNTYSVNGSTLTFIMGDIAVMRFSKRETQ